MAEAHSAVAFSFSITHEGWDVNFDREVLHLVWASGIRSWKKRLARFKNNVRNGIFPAPLQSLWAMMGIVIALRYANNNFVKYMDTILQYLPGTNYAWQIVSCFILSFIFWLIVIYVVRYTLKLLLIYKGWMYESRGGGKKVSLQTKLWGLGVKLLSLKSKPLLYSYQGSLPKLPLPPINETMKRYLKSVRPLMNDAEYESMVKLANEFENGIAVKLQRYLWLKSWWSSNYVSDWWEEYVYLRSRTPLIVNSNFYGIDAIMLHSTHIQAARAAMIIWQCLQYRRLIERQELEPIRIQGLVPLCSWQYERIFNTTRVPGAVSDKIIHYSDSRHIVVYHAGRYFKVIIYCQNRILQPCEIEVQIQSILDNPEKPYIGEERVGALTAADRTHWANTRTQFFFKGVNRQSLDAIEKSAFVVTLDDVPYEYSPEDSKKLDEFGRILMTGKGYDRWFDKSFTLCIGSNGRVGFNAEHSWADAAVMSHLWEFIIFDEAAKSGADAPVMGHLWEHFLCGDLVVGYQINGHTKGVPEFDPPKPIRLQWNLDPVLESIDKSYKVALALVNDIDLRILEFSDYGKGFMKIAKVSPDAFIQMALQLAYYRDAGKFSLTYEASMTRLYREGRTETVRPCTLESSAWVKSMLDPNVDLNKRICLLREACSTHQRGYQDAMCGKGIDRHLFCLYVISKYLEVESPFLNKVLSEPWRLSTSQTPHGQTTQFDLRKYPNCISAGGGFGPVANDGYGVSYIIAGENLIFFHISSKKSSLHTDSSRFAVRIKEALNDMKSLHKDWEKNMKTSS